MVGVSASIMLLALAVLAIRYGHVQFPYHEEAKTRQARIRRDSKS